MHLKARRRPAMRQLPVFSEETAMDEYSVDVLPGEVLGWVREDAARKSPRLWVRAAKSYWIDEVSTGESARPAEGDDVSPVMVRGVMEISPQGGRGGWTLQLVAQDSVGLREDGEDEGYENDDNMTVKAFEDDFLFPEYGEVEVVVLAEDAAAWRRFGRWLARKRARR
jgi:hypothetical protein